MLSHKVPSKLRPMRVGAERGLSIIEMMVGVAIGLFIVAGGAKLLAESLIGNRRIIVESRISQDLRAATDVIARDLRRAGYWEGSLAGAASAPSANAYIAVTPLPADGAASTVTYAYDRDGNNAVSAATESFGFRRTLDANGVGRIQMLVGDNNWQPLTDTASVNVTAFTVTPITGEISLGESCRGSVIASPTPARACCRPHLGNANLCKPPVVQRIGGSYTPSTNIARPADVTSSDNCPELVIRSFDIVVSGTGRPPNTDVRREIHETVRVRNDQVSHVVCP